jgi:hypothetical protein
MLERERRPEREANTLVAMERFAHNVQKQGDGTHRCHRGCVLSFGWICVVPSIEN